MSAKKTSKPSGGLRDRAISAREAANLTRPQAASLAGIPYTTLVNIEAGTVGRSAVIPRLAAIYGVNALWLESGRGSRTSKGAGLVDVADPDDRETRLLAIFPDGAGSGTRP